MMNQSHDSERLNVMRSKILTAATKGQEGHIPSSLSILDILYCLYIVLPKISRVNLQKNDIFILSKGHASLALYAVLEEAKIIDDTWIDTFGSFSSKFGGHPDRNKISGVAASTGSLGHGLPFSIGKVLANRLINREFSIFCLIGDGELNEGSNWESLLLAAHYKMHELTLIIDLNHSTDRALSLGDIESKFRAFGFHVETINGHSHAEITKSLQTKKRNCPTAIIAETIKGYGVPAMENNPAWHHAIPTPDQTLEMIRMLR
jgi:transketolase